MPWKECHKLDEKIRLVSRYLDGEKIAGLCPKYGNSRVTGRKIIGRYRQSGVEAFTDRSRSSARRLDTTLCIRICQPQEPSQCQVEKQ